MELKVQKRLAGGVMKCSPHRVRFDTQRLSDIKEAITKTDIKSLIGEGAIIKKPVKGISKVRSRKIKIQKQKGRQKGRGSKKGSRKSRLSQKNAWIKRVRIQREFLAVLKDKKHISSKTFRMLYKKIKGGFFRSKRHIKLFLEEKNLFNK